MTNSLVAAPLVRQLNLRRVLAAIATSGDEMSGSDLIVSTGLTRATVHAICNELIGLGWVREGETRREEGVHSGRPPRWFAFNERAGYLLGVDVGAHTTTFTIADLRGESLVTQKVVTDETSTAADQGAAVNESIRQAFAGLHARVDEIVACGAGLAVRIYRGDPASTSEDPWQRYFAARRAALGDLTAAPTLVDNDANLAALGEHWRGRAQGVDNLAVLLTGERFGVGLLESGRLLHGRGGAGEMRYLDMVDGVGNADGIAAVARQWANQALDSGLPTVLAGLAGGRAAGVTAEMVFRAAERSDRVALDIIDRLATRVARIIASLASVFDPELVVIGGAVSASAAALLDGIRDQLPALVNDPPEVAISTLGDSAVCTGALSLALNYVRENTLTIELPGPGRRPRPN